MDIVAAGITWIVWATGFATDFRGLKVDALDVHGRPDHRRAQHIAGQITTQRNYLAYSTT